MSTINKISGGAALIALALALPVAAEEQLSTKFKEHTGLQPVSTKNVMPTRAGDAPKRAVIEASQPTTPSNGAASNPDNMPYVTYDGAANPAQ